MTKALLILDLDETLLHASEEKLPHVEHHHIDRYWVYLRPGLKSFLLACEKDYRLAIWSSASDDYVEAMVATAISKHVSLEFVWGQSRGTYRRDLERDEHFFAKDLYKVERRGFALERTLIVDDDPRKVAKNYGNAIYVPAFMGDPADRILEELSRYLSQIASAPNFRRLEKRDWRRQALS